VKILRTIIWVLAAAGFLIFAIYNWKPVEVTLWNNLVLETKVPVLVVLAFALGFVPLWAYARSVTWGQSRRIRALENSLKHVASARQAETSAAAADRTVDKPGTSLTPPADPLILADTGAAGDAK
jgi:lipopolysaccharide assembly protein A